MNKTVWVAADVKSPDGRIWELLGIFETEVLACEACTARNHAVFPVELNQRAPDETMIAPNVRWPYYELHPST